MNYPQYTIGMSKAEIDTPALVLDIGLAEQNLAAMAAMAKRLGKSLRPHVKTHRTPILARMQLEHGAIGVSSAKLAEAEVMVQGGITDVLITSEIVGRAKINRLVGLSRRANLIGVVDDAEAAAAISTAFERAGLVHDVLVDVNVGQNRTGIDPGQPALALARRVAELPGLRLRGLQGYEGHIQHLYDQRERTEACRAAMRKLCDTARLVREAGLAIDIVSTAGTGTFAICAEFPEVTELQPGSYVVMDADYGRVGGVEFAHSLTILASIISRSAPDRAVCDAGLKASSVDAGLPVVKDLPGAGYVKASDEHGNLILEGEARRLRLGDKIELIPGHCDPTINLWDYFHVVRDGRLEAIWPIAGRGAGQ